MDEPQKTPWLTPKRVAHFSSLVDRGILSESEFASQMVDGLSSLHTDLLLQTGELIRATPLPRLRALAKELEKCDCNERYWKHIALNVKGAIARMEATDTPPEKL